MKRSSWIILAALIIFSVSTAEASKWVAYYEGTRITAFLDTESILDGTGGTKEVWVKLENKDSDCYEGKYETKCVSHILIHVKFYRNKTEKNFEHIFVFRDGTFRKQKISNSISDVDDVSKNAWTFLYSPATGKENWTYIAGQEGKSIFIDTASISAGPNGTKEAWSKIEYTPAPTCSPRDWCEVKDVEYARYFSNKSFCVLESIRYFVGWGNNGGRIYSCEPQKIEPNTLYEKTWQFFYR